MCYNFRTSLISYTLGIISGIFCLLTRQYVIGTLILVYSQIQLSEMMIWYGIDNNNININRKGTTFGKYILATHIVAIGIGIILSKTFLLKRELNFRDYIPLIIGIFFFLCICIYYYFPGNYPDVTYQQDRTCKDKSCQTQGNRLKWTYPNKWYILSLLLA